MGEGAVGWSALNQKFYFQQEREDGVPVNHYKKNHPVRSLVAVPILHDDRLEGVLSLDSSHLKYFAPDAVPALESFAAQISETIGMARLAKEREERAFEFQAFYHASKELSSLIDFEEIVQRLNLLCGEIVKSDFTAVAVTKQILPNIRFMNGATIMKLQSFSPILKIMALPGFHGFCRVWRNRSSSQVRNLSFKRCLC